jgi:glucosamine kinase
MTLYLGIDGGGTGCRAVLANDAGIVLGHGMAGPANIASDPDGALANILHAAQEAMTQALGDQMARQELPNVIAGLGLAGVNAAGAAGRLQLALPFAKTRIETDAVAAAKGALAGTDGIVAALGTGSVYAVQKGGDIRCFGGWGLVLGDEGSGAHLGRGALAMALRAVDGLVPMTPFLERLLDDHGGPAGVVAFAQTARAADFARLAPDVLDSTDPTAQSLWSQAVAQVADVLLHLRKAAPLPVTFIGGLGARYAKALSDIPQTQARGSALDGALLLAREAA